MSEEIIRASVVILLVSVLVTALRSRLGEYSILLVIVSVCIILAIFLGYLADSFRKTQDLFIIGGSSNEYFITALKALGISYITTFAADTCRDFGLSALAQTSEITGKIAIFILSMPLVTSILEAALKFVGL